MLVSKNSIICTFVLIASLCLLIFSGKETIAQNKIRIGVYDSRAVAIAFYNSKFSNTQKIFGEIHKRMNEAKEKNNIEEMKNIEYEANLRQAFMHEQGFGQGSVNTIMEMMRDKIAEFSKKENLDILTSKWELNFISQNVDIVDVTDKLSDLFEPNDKIKAALHDLKNIEPIRDAYLIKD